MLKVVVFDADGTLTPYRESSAAPFSFTLCPGVKEKTSELKSAGYRLAIASNQSLKRPMSDIIEQLRWTARQIGADMFIFEVVPELKKPHPSMLIKIARYFHVQPSDILFVGDQPTDEEAAKRFGCDFAYASEFFV